MKLLLIDSLAELRRRAAAWDDLWWRSPSALPTHRAELVAQWLEHFAARKPLAALCALDDGQLVAALPLTSQQRLKQIGSPAVNCWCHAGELLVDEHSDTRRAVALIIDGLRRTPWPLLMIDGVDLARPGWRVFRELLAERKWPAQQQPKFRAGVIDLVHDWDAYVAAWSSNTRRMLKKLRAKAEQAGTLELQCLTQLRAGELQRQLRRACEIEDRSWKGPAGTSILRTAGMFDFFCRQAEQLGAWDQLELYFLLHNGRAIAFDYCYAAKGVMGSQKIGYDEQFRELGPGQLLRLLQLESWQGDMQRSLLDTLGILDEAKAKWCTRTYEFSRLTCSAGGLVGGAAMFGYQRLRSLAAQLRGQRPVDASFAWQPGAARCLGDARVTVG